MFKFYLVNGLVWLAILVMVVNYIKNRRLSIELSINWVLSIVFILLLSSTVTILNSISIFLGISYPPAILIVVAFYLGIIILLRLNINITKLQQSNKRLMQDLIINRELVAKQSDILIVLPAFNEEKNIAKVVNGIREKYDYDILVIDDGSKDKTSEIINSLNCFSISHSYNCGYGTTLETGYRFASRHDYGYIIQFDSDGQHSVDSIKQLVDSITKNNCNVVIGSRFLAQDGHYNPGIARGIGMTFFRFLVRAITKLKISDPTSGLQILDQSVFNFFSADNRFPDKYPDADMIIMLHKNGFKISEIPVIMYPNQEGKSMHSGILKPIFYMIYMILSIFVVMIRKERA